MCQWEESKTLCSALGGALFLHNTSFSLLALLWSNYPIFCFYFRLKQSQTTGVAEISLHTSQPAVGHSDGTSTSTTPSSIPLRNSRQRGRRAAAANSRYLIFLSLQPSTTIQLGFMNPRFNSVSWINLRSEVSTFRRPYIEGFAQIPRGRPVTQLCIILAFTWIYNVQHFLSYLM